MHVDITCGYQSGSVRHRWDAWLMSNVLESLQFTGAGVISGLVAVREGVLPEGIEEQYAVRQAAGIGEIDYVFFRRFWTDVLRRSRHV